MRSSTLQVEDNYRRRLALEYCTRLCYTFMFLFFFMWSWFFWTINIYSAYFEAIRLYLRLQNLISCLFVWIINHFNISNFCAFSVPEICNENELFFVNSTNAVLFLDGWPERECPIQYFTVSYRLDNNWNHVGKGQLAPEPISISDLVPAALYTFRIGVFNEAGNILQNFVLTTRSLSGG